MGWITPVTRATGYLVPAAVWNSDVVDNPSYLKGQAGIVVLENSIVSTLNGSFDLGASSTLWRAVYGKQLFGNRKRADGWVREVRIIYEAKAVNAIQASFQDSTAGSAFTAGGAGQWVMSLDVTTASAHSRIEHATAINSALANNWIVANKPYYRQDFAISTTDSRLTAFFGFRQTVGSAIPAPTESYAGLEYSSAGAGWHVVFCDGTSENGSGTVSVSTGTRHIVETLIESATASEVWLDGTLLSRNTTKIPVGTLLWQSMIASPSGGGGALTVYVTVGETIVQENLT